jgi:hypothetical protein
MEESERVEDLKKAYENGVISINELEEEVEDELEKSSRNNTNLNTSDSLPQQIWMSESESMRPDPAELKPVGDKMHLPVKPVGGMWTSTYTPEDEYDSDWIRWCSSEGFYGGRHKWLLEPKENLDILVVDSLEDLQRVAEAYEKDTYKGASSDRLSDTVFNFKAISNDFDAMRLTEDGQWDTRMPGRDEPDLYGWDSESVLNFRWNWRSVEYLEECEIDATIDSL